MIALDEAGRGRFLGVRYITAHDDHPPLHMGTGPAMDDPGHLAGVCTVGAMGFRYDAMVYHPQLPAPAAVARACPDTPIVLDHLGGSGLVAVQGPAQQDPRLLVSGHG